MEPQGLDRLMAAARACRACVETPRGAPLPHAPRPILRGRASAVLLIAGQAPGTRVHASGLPFTDPSGVRLRRWMGLDDAAFYDEARIAILPMGFCFPGQDKRGGDLPPRPECAPLWRAPLVAALPNIALTLALGLHAIRWHTGDARPLDAVVADWRRHLAERGVVPLPHPSWRNNGWIRARPWFEAELVPEVRARVGSALAALPMDRAGT
jgi:uracil-DNA glycosylase